MYTLHTGRRLISTSLAAVCTAHGDGPISAVWGTLPILPEWGAYSILLHSNPGELQCNKSLKVIDAYALVHALQDSSSGHAAIGAPLSRCAIKTIGDFKAPNPNHTIRETPSAPSPILISTERRRRHRHSYSRNHRHHPFMTNPRCRLKKGFNAIRTPPQYRRE